MSDRNAKVDTEPIEQEIGGSTGNSFKDIVMFQLKTITNLSNVEFRGGFYTLTPTKGGQEKEIYVSDTRDVFCNAVYTLALLLRTKFDKKMKPSFKRYKDVKKNLISIFIKASSPTEEVILSDAFYDKEEDKILLETYKNKKLTLHQNLFAALCSQLARLNYMEIGGGIF